MEHCHGVMTLSDQIPILNCNMEIIKLVLGRKKEFSYDHSFYVYSHSNSTTILSVSLYDFSSIIEIPMINTLFIK